MEDEIGRVVGGSLSEGITVELSPTTDPEDILIGDFVVIEGAKYSFFSLITDVELPKRRALAVPKSVAENPGALQALRFAGLNPTIVVKPFLMLERSNAGGLKKVKTIPPLFSQVRKAGKEHFEEVFGGGKAFIVGHHIEKPECLIGVDAENLVRRSIGVFGRTGTGKTFLTKILVAGIYLRLGKRCPILVFDFHSEYWRTTVSEAGTACEGLKELFREKVAVYTLAESRTSSVKSVEIPLEELSLDDILILKDQLGLTEAGVDTLIIAGNKLGEGWLYRLLNEDEERLARELGNVNRAALRALIRKLKARFGRLGFVKSKEEMASRNAIKEIMDDLRDGKIVVIDFGSFQEALRLDAYLVVANFLTRKIDVTFREEAERGGVKRLLIVVEEAHNFLKPDVSKITIFGTIARELRKFGVTLMIVDQRPSEIDPEVLSQIANRFILKLNDERDISATTTGLTDASWVRKILYTMEPKAQAVAVGDALPMPVLFTVQDYGEATKAIRKELMEEEKRRAFEAPSDIDDIFGDA